MPEEITIELPYEPRPWQTVVHESLEKVRFAVLVVHRRGGKTVLAVNALIAAALRTERPDGRYAYLAPLLKQARSISWDYLRKYTATIPGVEYHESLLEVRLPNGALIRLYGADNPDALRGIYLDGVVLDEVAQMRPNLWGEVIRPELADRQGWALFIGTPRGINLFSELYYGALQNDQWFANLYTYQDTGAILPEEIESARAMMTADQFAQEFMCDFQAGASDLLIPIDVARACSGRHLDSTAYVWAPKILGVDVARFGDDRTVLFPRQGLIALEPSVFRGLDTMQVAEQVGIKIRQWEADCTFIDTSGGLGAGPLDRLQQLGFDVQAVEFGSKASKRQLRNKRDEMWVEMREWLKGGAAIPKSEELIAELCAPRLYYAPNGQLRVESKDDMKERGMPSPDLADALALTFAYPVPVRSSTYRKYEDAAPKREYDPFAILEA